MSRSNDIGMITFDQGLSKLLEEGLIGFDEALCNADSQNELRLKVKLESKRARASLHDDPAVKGLSMQEEDKPTLLRR